MKRLLLPALLVLLWVGRVNAAATFDAATGAYCDALAACSAGAAWSGTFTVVTFSHTTGSGSDRAAAVFVLLGCGGAETAPAVSSVTYAGVALSNSGLPNVAPSAVRHGKVYALAAGTQPTSGANNVVVTLSTNMVTACGGSSGRVMIGIVTVAGVDQTTTFTASNGSSGSSTTASTTLSSSGANDLVAHSGCSGDNTSAPTGTQRWVNNNTASSCNSNVGATAAGGTTTTQFTVASSDSWIELAVSFKEAGGGGSIVSIINNQFRRRWMIFLLAVLLHGMTIPWLGLPILAADHEPEYRMAYAKKINSGSDGVKIDT